MNKKMNVSNNSAQTGHLYRRFSNRDQGQNSRQTILTNLKWYISREWPHSDVMKLTIFNPISNSPGSTVVQTDEEEIYRLLSSVPVELSSNNGLVKFIYLYSLTETKEATYEVAQFRTWLDIIAAIKTFYDQEIGEEEIRRINPRRADDLIYQLRVHLGRNTMKLSQVLDPGGGFSLSFNGIEILGNGVYQPIITYQG